MSTLIEALNIFLTYRDVQFPTHCEHDILMVVGFTEDEISKEDKTRLAELHFEWNGEYDCWSSFMFGSA